MSRRLESFLTFLKQPRVFFTLWALAMLLWLFTFSSVLFALYWALHLAR